MIVLIRLFMWKFTERGVGVIRQLKMFEQLNGAFVWSIPSLIT